MDIKTRFAPSPSGYLHFGGARTALYSWLFARKHNGNFVLRIEDSDVHRSVKKNVDIIMEEMRWLNLDWDEGPYFQTDRLDRYNSIIDNMLQAGTAYRCFCSKERLQVLRKTQILSGKKPRYDGHCRIHSWSQLSNNPCVVRFRNPQDGLVVFNDQIRGPIIFNNNELDDLIIRRSDGYPTYNFCVVVDDMDMNITHVIRGEDHISNTPRQINILNALHAPIPRYAHLSIILGHDGKKLSKRYHQVSITQYREDGFLPEAILNFLVRLGWSHGNQEIFSISEMKNIFNLESVNTSSSTFNIKKLLWLNSYYINHLPLESVAQYLSWHMKNKNVNYQSGPELSDLIKFFGKRYKTLKEIVDNCYYFYHDFDKYDDKIAKRYLCSEVMHFFKVLQNRLEHLTVWTYDSVRVVFLSVISDLKLSVKTIGMPLRVAITGATKSPELVAVLYICGQVRSLRRLDMALNYIIRNNVSSIC